MKTTGFIALLLATCMLRSLAATPTLTFETAQPLTAGGVAINLGNHAAPRLVDWNNDGVLDLLVAGGDGTIWLFRQDQPANSTNFLAGVKVAASGSDIRVGTGYTGACFADLDGDGKRDLIAVGNDNRVRFYPNTATLAAPVFTGFTIVPGSSGEFVVPSNVGGRIDIADWDGDGNLDLLTGDFDGYITWYRDTGTAAVPVFGAPGIRLKRNGTTIQDAYNTHPRVYDFNQDGVLDLAYGINWGFFKVLLNTEGLAATNFPSESRLSDTNGADLNIRSLNGDDSCPDFADLTGDGVLDVISGGVNGKLFFMRGVSYTTLFQSIEAIMAAHTT
ncbi:MAG: VCBS repeat-containing protein, partial [Verrucomicrobiota bacterium]